MAAFAVPPGSVTPLQMATRMGDWVVGTVAGAIARNGPLKWQGVLNTEWGGMNEALFDLYDLTGNEAYRTSGALFNHHQWTGPLALGSMAFWHFFGIFGPLFGPGSCALAPQHWRL